MVGFALVLRDLVHEFGGIKSAVIAIIIGGILSWFVAPPALVVASVSAFLLAELADLTVYAPLHKKRMMTAVFVSGVVGSFVDSAVFLLLAFGSVQFIEGQFLGKMWMSAAAIPVLFLLRRYAVIGREI
jgi:uncharacterized PurR-regulated membrane protein YhhQ (DUF165 family)